jgi:hypothetical protein
LNLCSTAIGSEMMDSSSSGFNGAKRGGSAANRAETGGVRLFVDIDERDELELPNSGNFKLFGDNDSAKPDLRP